MNGEEGAHSEAYVRQLEDAVLSFWHMQTIDEARTMRAEYPRLMDFCAHIHHGIEHEQAMVRVNVWAEPEPPSDEDVAS